MALNYRRGSAAIQEAATAKSSGNFRPFLPQLSWRNDGDTKYVLVLTDIHEVATLLLHSFVPVGKFTKSDGEEFTKFEEFLSRKDVAIGEDYDDLEERLDREPKTRTMGVMVELQPVFEGGTKRVKSFVVKTETFQRKTDDGEVETVAPVIGLCTQSPVTLWGSIDSLYQSVGDLIEVPIQITRRGKDQNTRYDVIPFLEKPIDLSPVVEFLDGITYITDEERSGLIDSIAAEETDVARAQAVADFLLGKRIDELADAERYKELVGPLMPEDMPQNPWGRKSKAKNGASTRTPRPARRSPREPANEASEPVEQASVKSDSFAALKARVEAASR